VNVSRQFQEVRIFFTENRFIPILKQVAIPTISPVKPDHITGQQLAHALRYPLLPRTNEQVEMVVEKRPGMDTQGLAFTEGSQPSQEILSVLLIPKNGNPLNPSAYHMM
jgi:hypothetical protein